MQAASGLPGSEPKIYAAMRFFLLIMIMLVGSGLSEPTHAAAAAQTPSFKDFAASSEYPAKPAPLRTASHPRASMFRTHLSQTLKDGPRFAGNYAVATWGCGTNCQAHAIVDARTGDAYFPKEIASTAPDHPCERDLLEFRPDSRLIGVTRIRSQTATVTTYYEWSELKLTRVGERSRSMDEFCAGK